MGFRKQPKVYKIVWDEGDLKGLEVRVRALSVGKLLDLTAAANEAGNGGDLAMVVKPFAEALQDWNLEDENGKPVPATLKGVRDQDMGFIMAVVMKWMSVIADVDIPLPPASNSGGISAEESLGLESLSRSLAS